MAGIAKNDKNNGTIKITNKPTSQTQTAKEQHNKPVHQTSDAPHSTQMCRGVRGVAWPLLLSPCNTKVSVRLWYLGVVTCCDSRYCRGNVTEDLTLSEPASCGRQYGTFSHPNSLRQLPALRMQHTSRSENSLARHDETLKPKYAVHEFHLTTF